MSIFSEEQIMDAARFSSFAQKTKMAYWNSLKESEFCLSEALLDKVLLIACGVINKEPQDVQNR